MTDLLGAHRHVRLPQYLAIAVWLVMVAFCTAGLRHYRVQNELSQWAVPAANIKALPGMLILAWEPVLSQLQDAQLQTDLASLHDVEKCYPARDLLLASNSRPNSGELVERDLSGVVIVHNDAVQSAELTDRVESVCRSAGLDRSAYYLSGPTAVSAALDDWSQRGLQAASLLIGVTGFLGVWLFSQSLLFALRACTAVFGSQLLLTGTVSWAGQPMDMMLSAVPPLMMALGFSFAMHRAARADTLVPLVLCGTTTVAGFLALACSDAPAIRAFALWGAAGIAMVWMSVMIWVPPCNANDTTLPHHAGRAAATPMRTMVLCGAVVLTLLAIPAVASLKVSDNPLSGLPASSAILQDTTQIDHRLIGTLPSLIHGNGDRLTADQIRDWPGVQQVVTMASESGTSADKNWLILSSNSSIGELDAAVAASGADWSGPAAQVSRMGHSVVTTSAWALPMMSVLVGTVLLLVSRDWIAAVIGTWVCLLPIAAVVTVVSTAGLPVSLTALMSGAIAMGVAVDDTVHILYHRRRSDTAEAVRLCFRPCVHSSLIAVACVAWLMIAPFTPTAEFGLLLGCMILVALGADLVILPAALAVIPSSPDGTVTPTLSPRALTT